MSGGISGLMNFGKQQAASNATTAVAYNIDKAFHVARAPQRADQLQRRAGDPLTSRAARRTSRATATRA